MCLIFGSEMNICFVVLFSVIVGGVVLSQSFGRFAKRHNYSTSLFCTESMTNTGGAG